MNEERNETREEREERVRALLAKLNITAVATFVPLHAYVPPKGKKDEPHQHVLRWNVEVLVGLRVAYSTEFTAGFGHVPELLHRNINNLSDRTKIYEYLDGKRVCPFPDLDFFYCTASDASVLDERDFESWADSLGFDSDSRAAEKIYTACLANAVALRAMIGDAGLTELREAFQDW